MEGFPGTTSPVEVVESVPDMADPMEAHIAQLGLPEIPDMSMPVEAPSQAPSDRKHARSGDADEDTPEVIEARKRYWARFKRPSKQAPAAVPQPASHDNQLGLPDQETQVDTLLSMPTLILGQTEGSPSDTPEIVESPNHPAESAPPNASVMPEPEVIPAKGEGPGENALPNASVMPEPEVIPPGENALPNASVMPEPEVIPAKVGDPTHAGENANGVSMVAATLQRMQTVDIESKKSQPPQSVSVDPSTPIPCQTAVIIGTTVTLLPLTPEQCLAAGLQLANGPSSTAARTSSALTPPSVPAVAAVEALATDSVEAIYAFDVLSMTNIYIYSKERHVFISVRIWMKI